MATDDPKPRRRFLKVFLGLVALVAVAAVAIPYVYVHFINDPAPELSFSDLDTADSTSAGSEPGSSGTASGDSAVGIDGTWVVAEGSTVGYRVKEVIAGQSTEGVGRTTVVDGSATVTGSTVTNVEFSADVASFKSDQDRRDGQFRGRIMNADEFPVAIFTLNEPFDAVNLVAPTTEDVSLSVDGVLTLRGVEKPVTVPFTARCVGDTFQLQGSIDLVFADFGIPDPSIGPVTTENHGLLEFALVLKRS